MRGKVAKRLRKKAFMMWDVSPYKEALRPVHFYKHLKKEYKA